MNDVNVGSSSIIVGSLVAKPSAGGVLLAFESIYTLDWRRYRDNLLYPRLIGSLLPVSFELFIALPFILAFLCSGDLTSTGKYPW